MENAGWIKTYRALLDNPVVMKDAEHLAVWMYLLLNATHTEYPALFKGKKIMLQAGQLITGRKSIAKDLSVAESKVTRILNLFENEQQIKQQTSNKNRLISIVNWDIYQATEQQTEHQVNNNRTTSEHQVNTNKNDKNNKKVKNPSIYPDDSIDEIDAYTQLIKEQIEYDYLIQDYPNKQDILEEILNILVETVAIKRKSIRIANTSYPYEMVKGKLMKLDMGHIRYVLDCLDKNTSKVRNIKSYLLTTLYNATNTIGNYYRAEVNHDMYGNKEE